MTYRIKEAYLFGRYKQPTPKQQHRLMLSEQLCARIQAAIPPITYPELPVSAYKTEICKLLSENSVVVIAGDTGSGKTTQLPKMCLELGYGIKGAIAHTQPRRIAAKAAATRLASELSSPLGATVGYKVRFEEKLSEITAVKVLTDGMLLAELSQDKLLLDYEVVIIDEAHERSVNIDVLMGALKELLKKRNDLKVIITSATINEQLFADFFNAPIIKVPGRMYPIEQRYEETEEDLPAQIANLLSKISPYENGDVLIFFPTEAQIRETHKVLSQRFVDKFSIFPLYSRLPLSEQNRIFASTPARKVVLSTNIAETSLTVPNIRFVIDTGKARVKRYSNRSHLNILPIENISQASANQRAGRCGRVGPGVCIRLYSQNTYLTMSPEPEPEICRSNLSSLILLLKSIGFDMNTFELPTPPESKMVRAGLTELVGLGLLDEQENLTKMGYQCAQMPVDPPLARVILEGQTLGVLKEILIIVSFLSVPDPKEIPPEKTAAATEKHAAYSDPQSDFMAIVRLYTSLQKVNITRAWAKQNYFSYNRLKEWFDIYQQLLEMCDTLRLSVQSDPTHADHIHMALLSGYLMHIGYKTEEGDYIGVRGTRFAIGRTFGKKKGLLWIMAHELLYTHKVFAHVIAAIKPEWIERYAGDRLKFQIIHENFDVKQGEAYCQEKLTFFGLHIHTRKRALKSLDRVLARKMLIQALSEGVVETNLDFYAHNKKIIETIQKEEQKSRKEGFLINEEMIYQFYDKKLADICTLQELKHHQAALHMQLEDFIQTPANLPTEITIGKHIFPLTYAHGGDADGVTAKIQIEELEDLLPAWFDRPPNVLTEKIQALLKSLPKEKRMMLHPVAQYAHAISTDAHESTEGLIPHIIRKIRQMTGFVLQAGDFSPQKLPAYMFMRFELIKNGNTILTTRSFEELKNYGRAKSQVHQVFPSNFSPKATPNLTTVLAPKESGVHQIRINPSEAPRIHQAGLRQLLTPPPVKALWCIKAKALGIEETHIQSWLTNLVEIPPSVHSSEDFTKFVSTVKFKDIFAKYSPFVGAYVDVLCVFKNNTHPAKMLFTPQLLVVAKNYTSRLPVYAKALETLLTKDSMQLKWSGYAKILRIKNNIEKITYWQEDPALHALYFSIYELFIQTFAQQLKTLDKVSEVRIQKTCLELKNLYPHLLD